MATWVDEYMTMVEDCEKRESKLTEWEAGNRRMHPAFWELFRIKIGSIT